VAAGDDENGAALRIAACGGVAACVLVAIHGCAVIFFTWPISEYSIEKAGSFGDTYGWLTSLFSGLAFIGLIVAILLQREELQLQRKEISLTRAEMTKQNFEATFFQMLRLHNDIVGSMDVARGAFGQAQEVRGRDCFVTFFAQLRGIYGARRAKGAKAGEAEVPEEEDLREAWLRVWKERQADLGHYFRFVYTVVKFVKNSEADDKRLYTNMVRAQLSDAELLILFYNCAVGYGVLKFKPLVEEFAFFDNLPLESLLDPGHRSFFDASAYGSQR